MFADSTLFSSLWWAQPRSVPPILTLPDELIAEIASHARLWSLPPVSTHEDGEEIWTGTVNLHARDSTIDEDPVCLPTDLAHFSATSRIFRDVVTPVLLRDVQITSAKRLRALAAMPAHKLAFIRILSLHLDSDFFAEFARSLDPHFRTPQHANVRSNISPHLVFPSPPLMQILCSVLASAPLLQSFSVRLAKASARSSAWKHFSFRSRGVSWKRAFEENMRMILMQKDKAARLASPFTLSTTPPPSPGALARQAFSRFSWPYLVHIHLDALEDIGPLLQMAPNLTHLSLRMLEGFDSLSCNQFLNDFRAATLPKLKALSFSARSLHLTDREESAVRGVELLEEIGQACPKLEYLDLKVNAYATSILPFVTVYNRSSYSVLVTALANFPNLRTVHFPGSLFDQEEMDLFLVIGLDADERSRPDRRFALNRVARREWDAMAAMAAVAPNLRSFSWVRRRDTDRRIEECSIEYTIHRMKNAKIRSPQRTFAEPIAGSSRSPWSGLGMELADSRDTPSPSWQNISPVGFSTSVSLPTSVASPPYLPSSLTIPTSLDVDHIDLTQIHPPPRVHEISRNISSPVSGPSIMGYARNTEGLNEFTSDHPVVSFASVAATVVVLAFMVYMRFHTFLHMVSIAGFLHMVYARTFVAPIAMLCIVDIVTILSL